MQIGAVMGERVRTLRQACGLSQAGLALAVGVHLNTISDVERGKDNHISAIRLGSIAKHLGTSIDYLLGLSDNEDVATRTNRTTTG